MRGASVQTESLLVPGTVGTPAGSLNPSANRNRLDQSNEVSLAHSPNRP